MIEKVAIVAAVRDSFSEDVGGLYTSEEMEQAAPIDVTPQESQEEVRMRKMAQIEEMKREQEKHQSSSYPENEIPDFEDEPLQGELLEEMEY